MYYIQYDYQETERQLEFLLNSIPIHFKEKAKKFRQKEDCMRAVLGKHLIKYALVKEGYPENCLNNLKVDQYNRPFIDTEIDFNLSHCKNYVVCAIGKTVKVGIDIEEIIPVNNEEFRSFFHSSENEKLNQSKDRNYDFYSIWTKKEAVCKANGKGLLLELSEIDTTTDLISCEYEKWSIIEINIDSKFKTHLAVNDSQIDPMIIQLNLNNLINR